MMYISGFLFFLSVMHLVQRFRTGQKEAEILAITFFLAGLGSTLATFFALETLGLL